jgi:hypothetical protein
MSPQNKLRIASILMELGILPWVLTLVWVAATLLLNVRGRPPRIFMLDPIAMVGVMMVTFAIAVIVAGLSTLWSLLLTIHHEHLRSRKIVILRIIVAMALGLPLLLAVASRYF